MCSAATSAFRLAPDCRSTTSCKRRLPITLKLVSAASWLLSIIFGVSIGVVTALRQYSAFDYIVTFFTFVFFSLPVFWVAVILKDLGGIRLNDWFRDGGELSTSVIVVGAISVAVLAYSIAGGRLVAPGHDRCCFRRGSSAPSSPTCRVRVGSRTRQSDGR